MCKFGLVVLFVFALALPGFAELSNAEKDQLLKLHRAGVHAGRAAWNSFSAGAPARIYWAGQVRADLAKALLRLAHSDEAVPPPPVAVEYPESFGEPIPNRAAVVASVWPLLDGVIVRMERVRGQIADAVCEGEQCEFLKTAVDNIDHALLLARDVDRTLAYDNPLLPQFPLQFGIHGDFETAQRSLAHSRRLLGYFFFWGFYVFYWDDAADLEAFASASRCLMEAYDDVTEIIGMSVGVQQGQRDPVELAFRQLEIAAREFPGRVRCAIREQLKVVRAPFGSSSYRNHMGAVNAISQGWHQMDFWIDRFTAEGR